MDHKNNLRKSVQTYIYIYIFISFQGLLDGSKKLRLPSMHLHVRTTLNTAHSTMDIMKGNIPERFSIYTSTPVCSEITYTPSLGFRFKGFKV